MASSKKTFALVLALSAAVALRGETIRLKAGDLAHRWSFNGNLKDSVGKSDATAVDTVTLAKGQCLLPGGRHGSGVVSLGSGILPKDGGLDSAGTDPAQITGVRHVGGLPERLCLTGANGLW